VDFPAGKVVGDVGEHRVAELLRHYADANPPARYVSDLMLSRGTITSQMDHVLIDAHGVLIIEVKTWRDASVLGTADEKSWTVVYHGFSKQRTLSPLRQLMTQRDALRKALRDAKAPLGPDELSSVVVFVGTKIDRLDLDDENRRRVTTIDDLGALLAMRAAAGSETVLDDSAVARRFLQLDALNRSDDAGVQQQHAAYRGGASAGPAAQATALSQPPRTAPTAAPGDSADRLASGSGTRSFGSGARSPAFDSPGDWRRAPRSRAAQKFREFVATLAVLALFWACVATGVFQGALTAILLPAFRLNEPAVTSPAITPSSAPTLAQAKVQLFQVAPQLRGAVTDLETPTTTASGDLVTYTWHYASKASASRVVIRSYGLTLGPGGVLRAVLPGQ